MDIRRKNTIKIRAFHRKLALRLGILGILAAVLFGVITWFDQGNRIIDINYIMEAHRLNQILPSCPR